MDPILVTKRCESLRQNVQIRRVQSNEIPAITAKLGQNTTKREYKECVVDATVQTGQATWRDRISADKLLGEIILQELYNLVRLVNPNLDITRVGWPSNCPQWIFRFCESLDRFIGVLRFDDPMRREEVIAIVHSGGPTGKLAAIRAALSPEQLREAVEIIDNNPLLGQIILDDLTRLVVQVND